MRDYELVYIVSPEVAEENLNRVVEKVNQFIAARGGQVDNVNSWGKRRLAYPIGPHREGIYYLTYFKLNPARAQDLENSLHTTEEVIRHLVVRLEEAQIKQRELLQQQELQRQQQRQLQQEQLQQQQQEQQVEALQEEERL
ncbi:MAG TPA: 30S ribosomal protein S6, partial [Dehalococcoidia bacterium]|nr:30S ribosomal protein S6 [Dehalococcoidia bacterium]